jgi:hypothetical protein
MAGAIDNIIKSSRTRLGSMIQEQAGAAHTYRNQIPMDTQERQRAYEAYNKHLDALEAQWEKEKGPWYKALEAERSSAPAPSGETPKYSGSHSQTGGQGSIPTMSPEAASKSSSGTVFRGEDGKLYKVR